MLTQTQTKPEPTAQTEPDEWNIEIKSNPGLFDINLRDLWQYRNLIAQLVRRDFVSAYKQTILGPIWHLIDPLVTTLMYAFIFGGIAQLSTDGLPRILFYLPGISLWTLFSNNLLGTSSVFNSNAGIFGKVYFPRLTVPIASTIFMVITFGFQLVLFICLVLIHLWIGTPVQITWYALLTPFFVLLTALLGLGFGMLMASVTTRYRDIGKLVSVSMRLLMYATPVIYPMSKVQAAASKHPIIAWFIEKNPMSPLIEGFRYIWLGSGTFSAGDLVYATVFALVVVIWGMLVFNKTEKIAMDSI